MPKSLPFRQIHLDFHTSPAITDVGRDFDAAEFARTMKRAHVNSVNVFAKCHHGHLYTNTQRPERHPGLRPGLNLVGEQVEALHREGIKAPIYISVQCDEYAANTHPEWIARQEDGRPVGAGPLQPGWQVVDMSSPYQEYLAEQVEEILAEFKPFDGIWFDMCWDQPSLSKWAKAGMLKDGLRPENETDRAKYAREVAQRYMKRFHGMVQAATPGALVFFNCRPYGCTPEEVGCFEQFEIEALPTGGWGYLYFPRHVRYLRSFGKACVGMTARFHKSWADFGGMKPEAALEYECAQMLANGAMAGIGDQLHPRGTLDQAVYDRIGRVYAKIEEREPWLEGAEPVTQIGVLTNPNSVASQLTRADQGATRMLTQLKHQFDFVDASRDWAKYDLIVLPDEVPVDAAFAAEIESYLAKGGRVLATGTSGLADDGKSVLLPSLGVSVEGPSPFTTTYVRFEPAAAEGVPATDHVMYERGLRVRAREGAEVLARVVEPYFERTWEHFSSHFQTPPDSVTDYAAAVRKGNAAYIAYPIFGAYAQHGNEWMRLLVRSVLDLLLPEPLVRAQAPTGAEVTVTRQGERSIVHVLYYTPERRADGLDLVEDVVPLFDVPVALKLPVAPKRVYLAPTGQDVAFTYADGYASARVPRVDGHAMVVFE